MIAALLLASTLAEPTAAAAPGPRTLKANFVREMAAATANKKIAGTKTIPSLRKKVMEKATLVPPGDRKLQNNQNGNNQANGNANVDAQGQQQYAGSDGADDYFMSFGEWNNAFGFDPTQYSLSYHRCAEVRQFDDELAATEDTDSVFATKHMAVFRFCPSETCMGYKQEEEEDLNWWNRTYAQYLEEQEEAEQEEEQQWKYAYGEEPETIGAGGEGCQSNYGEYLIELPDYLQLMQEFREERYEAYCDYCEKCIYNMYTQWMNSQARGRDLKEFDDRSWKNDIEALEGDFSWEAHRKLGGCPGIDSCWRYKNICGGLEEKYEDYFECTEVQRNNGMTVYIGPHCAQDGFTVTLGVFGDEYCNEYIGNGVNIQNILGEKLEENYMIEYVSGTVNEISQMNEVFPEFGFCIPCKEEDLPYYVQTDDEGEYDNYGGDSQVAEICQNLYQASARCDKHFRSWNNKAKQNKILAAKMDFQCDFIDSVVMGNYDEMGFVLLDQENITNPTGLTGLIQKTFSFRTASSEMAPAEQVTSLQVFGLCASIFACCILGVWAATLHSGKKVKGWRPRSRAAASPSIARQDSGIGMARSATMEQSSYVSAN